MPQQENRWVIHTTTGEAPALTQQIEDTDMAGCGYSQTWAMASAASIALACSGTEPTTTDTIAQAVNTYDLDVRRSLAVTEQPILARFSFERVMNQLVAQSGITGLTATQLFNDWWDTQNPFTDPNDAITHCDDPELATRLNGFPYDCRPAPSEGFQSQCDPFEQDSECAYVPVGLFNRFDQAPEDGAHCGEYRIIYAKATGTDPETQQGNRNTIIFEANMANPHPEQGLKGCKKIVDRWADLTDENDLEKRADKLEQFYFDGFAEIPPVVSIERFGDNPDDLGQVRTNQFVGAPSGWQLREFKLIKDCSATPCTLLFEPVTNKVNAFGGLFDPASGAPQAANFRAFFPSQVEGLAAQNLSDITLSMPDEFNTGRSVSSSPLADEMRYAVQLGPNPSSLRSAIEAELSALSSSLTVDDIVLRAQAMSCAGCHRLNRDVPIGDGLIWPADAGFTHVNERVTETVNGVVRFPISNALDQEFLPHRKQVMEDFLENKPKVPRGPHVPIGGFRSHG